MVRIIDASVIGFRKTQFVGQDGSPVYGYNVYFSFAPDGIEGMAADRFYLSVNAFKKVGIDIGSVIQVAYTGKKYELVA